MLADWLVIAAAVLTPVTAYLGVVQANRRARSRDQEDRVGAVEQDRRTRREQTLSQFQWACNHVTSGDPATSALGVATLTGMKRAGLLEPQDATVLEEVLKVLLANPLARLSQSPDAGVARVGTLEATEPAVAQRPEEEP